MEYGWIASKDDEVRAVLTSTALHVRPPGELVPRAMQGTPLGAVFERLVRMNDGERHTALRRRVEERLARWSEEDVHCIAAEAAARLAPHDVGAYTIARLLKMRDPEAALPWIRDFAGAIAPGASDEAIARGIPAVEPLLAALPACDDFDELANMLGLLFQSYAATARLIDIMLAHRTDAPALFTRRYAVEDTVICGASLKKGDAVIALLTSPELHFGAGRHACPGQRIAQTIARAACLSAEGRSSPARP